MRARSTRHEARQTYDFIGNPVAVLTMVNELAPNLLLVVYRQLKYGSVMKLILLPAHSWLNVLH